LKLEELEEELEKMEQDSEIKKKGVEENQRGQQLLGYNYDLEDDQERQQAEQSMKKHNGNNMNLNSSILENDYLNEKYSDNVEKIVLTESLQ